ncbi:MAG: PKD domain-containing protein [Chitinophagaceae bacterium]
MRFCHSKLLLLLSGFILYAGFGAMAQTCPENIDFENGNFDGWTCYTGNVTGNGTNVINLSPSGGPISDRHMMLTSFPGNGVDPFGGFPVNCPNGSGHSIRLGNPYGGGQAEGISYEFVIPANENYYTLIYNYAVVFQDPNHQEYQQPRMEIEITNVTDNKIIDCSSFTFVPYGSILPGFFEAPAQQDGTPVWCKDWTAVSINLDGHAGKTIKLFFKTADCTFQRHFGYAYIDVNSECSGTFVGAAYCPDDTLVNVVAPYGYQNYTWYNNTFSQILGSQQILTLKPPPPVGTTIAVKLDPYAGYGCPDTLYAKLLDTLTVTAHAGADILSCNHKPVPIGTPPKAGLVYEWFPTAGLNNPNISNPHAAPDITTKYVLTVRHDGGGCVDTDTVEVKAGIVDTSLQLQGKTVYCIGKGDSSVLVVQPAYRIQWYQNDSPIAGAAQTIYRATVTGVYFAELTNDMGCVLRTRSIAIDISSIPVPGVNSGLLNQCLVGNQFDFQNTSTNAIGPMQYSWTLGNGITSTARDLTYSYPQAGVYDVKMLVSSNAVCFDSTEFKVTIYQNAIASFTAAPICINLPMQAINNTVDTMNSPVNYIWNFGNGQTSDLRNPPAQIYTAGGKYSVTLSVNTNQCPTPLNILSKTLVIDIPKTAVNYPTEYAVIDYPYGLEARPIGSSAIWSPGTYLDTRNSFTPIFRGPVDQLYTIKITTETGCVTVDTQMVKTVTKADIFVPTAFTPNNDGLNDYLRPLLHGVKQIKYFRIFNRWGQLIYERKTVEPGWDGTISGVPQPSQAFVWMVEGMGVDKTVIIKRGTTMLIR